MKRNESEKRLITQVSSLVPTPCQQKMIERKYGMFIHFGINTFNDMEWSNGKLPPQSYAPPEIDVDQWVRNAYTAGMNYIILITKHHDGFCMWNTKYTDYSIASSKNDTDVVKKVSEACKKYGVKLGLYYSLWDRHEKCYKNDEKYIEFMMNQLSELLGGNYGEIVELWLDGGWNKRNSRWGVDRIYDLVKRLQPDCAMSVNHTIGKFDSKRGAERKYYPQHYKENMPMKYFPSDFRLLDPYFPPPVDPKIYEHNGQKYYLPFEATICIRNMRNWFWDPKYTKDVLISSEFIVEKYRQLTSQQNTLVVNVAPNIYGKQEESDMARLYEVADILKIRRTIS
jgi:alpha-L-fucosidase